jgi:hypothetical protein
MMARPRKGSVKLSLVFFAYHHFFLYEYVNCWLPFWAVGSMIGRESERRRSIQNLASKEGLACI